MFLDGERDYLPKKLGARIREIRTSKSMSENELAHECDISAGAVTEIENGTVDVSFLTLYQIAKCFQLSVGELLGQV